MTSPSPENMLEATYRRERRRVLATLIRLLGGFDAAEEALAEAFAAAAVQWSRDGIPDNPYAWLVSTGRFRTIDRWRRQARLAAALPDLEALADPTTVDVEPQAIQDDELRLIFTCCHPALPADARVALTLREVGGLKTEEIARAFLAHTPAIAQRIVRAKAKIRDEAIPYAVPDRAELPERLDSVLRVLYLIFNEGYAATEGPTLTRADLSAEAIRLTRLLADLLPEAETLGLLALMLLHEARREARLDENGDLILLQDQDRTLWDRALIQEAQSLIERGFSRRAVGPYLLQAAIAATHAESETVTETDWNRIIGLYDLMLRVDPSPVIALNRAVAVGMRDGPRAGLNAVNHVTDGGNLDDYHPAHAARADFHRQLGERAAARRAYQQALNLTRQPAEQRYFKACLAALDKQD